MTKLCSTCKQDLPLSSFAGADKYDCRPCKAAYNLEYHFRKTGKRRKSFHRVKDGMKLCARCLVNKPISEYRHTKPSRCWPCYLEETRIHRNKPEIKQRIRTAAKLRVQIPEVKRAVWYGKLRQTYGLSAAEVDTMLIRQGGKCDICRSEMDDKTGPQVDHNHTTGRVRGLLCSNCNHLLGKAKDNLFILSSAYTYLLDDYTFFQKPSTVTYPPQRYSLENTCPVGS